VDCGIEGVDQLHGRGGEVRVPHRRRRAQIGA
jgi:hypothetical protein